MDKKRIYAAGGLLGAVLASTCCILPFVFLLLGISGAWMSHVTALAPFQPIFLVASIGFLGAGFWKVYGKRNSDCKPDDDFCDKSQSDKVVKTALWIGTLFIVLAFSVEWLGRMVL